MQPIVAFFAGYILAAALFPVHAHAESVIINNYQTQGAAPSGRFCWGIIGCIIAGAMDAQDRQAQGPHACNVWNGRRYVTATCAP